jgi:hypothetical protein
MRGLLREMTRPRQSRETARFLPFFLLPLLGHCSRRSTPIPPAPRMNYLPLNAAEVALQGATTAALFGSLSYAASVVAAPMVRAVAAPSKALRLGRDIAAAHARGLRPAVATGALFGCANAVVTATNIVGARADRADLISSAILYGVLLGNRLRQPGGASVGGIFSTLITAHFTMFLLEGPKRGSSESEMSFTDVVLIREDSTTASSSSTAKRGHNSGGRYRAGAFLR